MGSERKIMKGLAMVAMMVLIMVLSGCRTTKYVPVETVRTEKQVSTRIVADTVRDTVMVLNNVLKHDSMAVRMQGDTVLVEHWHKEIKTAANVGVKDRTRTVHDTVYVDKSDSLSDAGWKAAAKVAATGWKKDGGGGNAAKTVVMLVVLVLATGTLIYKLGKK